MNLSMILNHNITIQLGALLVSYTILKGKAKFYFPDMMMLFSELFVLN